MDYISDNPNRNNDEREADEIAYRLGHEERRKLGKKPADESLHISHGGAHPLT